MSFNSSYYIYKYLKILNKLKKKKVEVKVVQNFITFQSLYTLS